MTLLQDADEAAGCDLLADPEPNLGRDRADAFAAMAG